MHLRRQGKKYEKRRNGKSMQVNNKRADALTQATITLLSPFKGVVHTITADNGKEFAYHEKINEALNADVCFTYPYSSWERGLNENTNGLLRQYFPKKTDFKKVSKKMWREQLIDLTLDHEKI